MDALVVFALGIDDFDGFSLVDEYTAVTYLSTHLSVERSVVEHEFIEFVLLLCHLAVAQDMTVVFGIVVAHKLLFASHEFGPVGVFHSGSVACAIFLFLHFSVKLFLIHRESVFAANQFGEVEWESVGVEQSECLNAIQLVFTLSLEFLHSIANHRDALFQCAQERVFLLLDHLGDELLLGFQFGESVTHFVHQCRHELVDESLFLSQEGVCIAHGTAQDAADDISCLCIGGQLTVGYRECHGAQMVCTDAHGDVDFVLLLADGVGSLFLKGEIFQSCQVLLSLDDGLEHVGIVVRVLALHHAHQSLKAHTRIDHVHGELFE